VDDAHDPSLARSRVVTLGGVTIHVSHGHELGRPTAELMLARYRGDVVIFGHTHKAVVLREAGGRVAFNPGAAGPRRLDLRPSVAVTFCNLPAAPERFTNLAEKSPPSPSIEMSPTICC